MNCNHCRKEIVYGEGEYRWMMWWHKVCLKALTEFTLIDPDNIGGDHGNEG